MKRCTAEHLTFTR